MWIFFTQLKIYIFPIYYRILNKKKLSIYFEKKIQPRYSEKFLFKIILNCVIMKPNNLFKFFVNFFTQLKNFFMKPNNLFKFFVKFFYSIKNIYFPDILQHFKQKKNFLYISKKKSSLDASIFAKNFCSTIAI